jgi:hypothetical protein
MDHSSERTLHVGDAAAEDLLVFDLRTKWFVLPGDARRDADRVDVSIEQDSLAGASALDNANDTAVAVRPDTVIGQAAKLAFDALADSLFLATKAGNANDVLRKLD